MYEILRCLEKRAQNGLEFLEKKPAIVHISLLLVALIVNFALHCLNIYDQNINFLLGIIITLLVVLCIEFVFFISVHLEKIKSNSYDILDPDKDPTKTTRRELADIQIKSSHICSSIKNLSQDTLEHFEQIKLDASNILNFISIQNPDKLPVIEDALKAKECVFISGTNMKFIDDKREEFINIGANVDVIFAVSDIHNGNVTTFLKRSYGKTDHDLELRRNVFDQAVTFINERRRGQEKKEIRTIFLDVFIPIAYMAVDYKNEISGSSIIHAKHYLLSSEKGGRTRAFNLSVHPKTKLYEKYREQITLIESSDGQLSVPPSE